MKSLNGKSPMVTEAATLLGGLSLVVLLTGACGGGDADATPSGGAAGMTAAAGTSSAGAATNGTSGATGNAGNPGAGGTGSGSAGTPSSGGSSAGSSAAGAGAGGSSAGSSTGGGSAGMSGGGSGGSGSGACAQATPINKSTCTAGESNCFSFFVASRARMFKLAQAFNGSTKGWGGDFRYGTADGLTGADKLCTQIAEESLPGNCRTWRAFLTTSKVNAIDRVGKGPWYDRLNRTIANNLTELADTRPGGITVASILNNLPNEDGTPHHNEEADCANANSCADNHDVLTGSNSDGKACTADTCGSMGGGFPGGGGPGGGGGTTITDWTCKDWTLSTPTAGIAPRCGHTWPTMTGGTDDWISRLTENGCAPGFNLVQNGGPMPTGNGSVGDGGGYGAIYCLALSE